VRQRGRGGEAGAGAGKEVSAMCGVHMRGLAATI
jgi:hypothetical protein